MGITKKYIIILIFIFGTVSIFGYFFLAKKQALITKTNRLRQVVTPAAFKLAVTPLPTDSPKVNQNDCDSLVGSSFRSVEQRDVGVGPNGRPVLGYWSIGFKEDANGRPIVMWVHSDVIERGTYICKDNILEVKFFNYSTNGYYDGDKKVLIFDGIEYKKVE